MWLLSWCMAARFSDFASGYNFVSTRRIGLCVGATRATRWGNDGGAGQLRNLIERLGVEFLKVTWTGLPSTVKEFTHRVETWNHTPCLLSVMPRDKTLAAHKSRRIRRYRFVIDQKETFAST
jgi:hypothetical protein